MKKRNWSVYLTLACLALLMIAVSAFAEWQGSCGVTCGESGDVLYSGGSVEAWAIASCVDGTSGCSGTYLSFNGVSISASGQCPYAWGIERYENHDGPITDVSLLAWFYSPSEAVAYTYRSFNAETNTVINEGGWVDPRLIGCIFIQQ